ncbi:MAG: L,D-transpeptidase [Jatrophihabitantaceae bacterium]
MTNRTRLAAVAVVATFALAACSTGSGSPSHNTTPGTKSSDPSTTSGTSTSTSTKPAVPTKTVRVMSVESDGETFGVGMPIILRFTPTPKDSAAFTKAVTVTVNGQPANGAWYWEKPYKDSPVEAHYRPRVYWPAHATIKVNLPIGGLSAGTGLVYGDKLTSVTIRTGDQHISSVDGASKRMTITSNGQDVKTIPVSLGEATEPTYFGTKVVMQKGEDVPGTNQLRPSGTVMMSGPGYSNDPVQWSVRVTGSGEYLHAAPWNSQIGQRSTSNGCTNLTVADARWFYAFSQIGDVVTYTNTGGKRMPSWDGLGDWNIPWGAWAQGGLLINH